jgi:hypothetical protein
MTPEEKADIARLIAGLVCDTEKNAAKAAWNEALERAAARVPRLQEYQWLAEEIRSMKHPEDRP